MTVLQQFNITSIAIIELDTSAAPQAYSLPQITPFEQGVLIKDATGNARANNVTISHPTLLIDGAASYVFAVNSQSAWFVSDGVRVIAVDGRGISTANLITTATNDNAAAGNVGQIIENEILAASEVTLTSSTAADIGSVSLTAGDWDVWGNVAIHPAATTTLQFIQGWINTASATVPTVPNKGAEALQNVTFTAGGLQIMPVGRRRVSLAVTTTVYLSARVQFGVSTCAAYGYIGARRTR